MGFSRNVNCGKSARCSHQGSGQETQKTDLGPLRDFVYRFPISSISRAKRRVLIYTFSATDFGQPTAFIQVVTDKEEDPGDIPLGSISPSFSSPIARVKLRLSTPVAVNAAMTPSTRFNLARRLALRVGESRNGLFLRLRQTHLSIQLMGERCSEVGGYPVLHGHEGR